MGSPGARATEAQHLESSLRGINLREAAFAPFGNHVSRCCPLWQEIRQAKGASPGVVPDSRMDICLTGNPHAATV